MKTQEKAFVLQRVPYSETSSILTCFTHTFGLKSFLLKGARKKYAHLIQPLSPIEFTFHHKENDQLATMFDAHFFYQPHSIQFHHMKTSLIFFQNEVLKNVLMEGQVDEALFHFLSEEYTWLNEYDYHPNYIIYWLFELISILGFNPLEIEQKDSRLQVLAGLKTLGKEDWLEYAFNKDERKLILQTLLTYFGEKIPNFSAFRTLEVFQVIWYD